MTPDAQERSDDLLRELALLILDSERRTAQALSDLQATVAALQSSSPPPSESLCRNCRRRPPSPAGGAS